MQFAATLMDRGGPLMWPLLLCSLTAATIAIERAVFWIWQALVFRQSRVDRLIALLEAGRYEEAVALAGAGRDAPTAVLKAGILDRDHGFTDVMGMQAAAWIDRMKQGLGILDTIITLAPLLGILGTVTGIIASFDLLGSAGIEDPKAVTGGIAQALITTATGLAVAIATLIPLNALVARTQRATRQLENIATRAEVAYRRGRHAGNHGAAS